MLIFLLMDSVTVLFLRKRHRLDPLWFGLMSAVGLMMATVIGGFVLRFAQMAMRRTKAPEGQTPTATQRA